MKVRVYLIKRDFGHIDFEDVESIEEAEDKFFHDDFYRDDVVIDFMGTGDWEFEDGSESETIQEDEE